MIHYNYSPNQLEEKALELLKQFDSERLTKNKPIDVYLEICEYQANTCAAAFLMPKPLLVEKVNRYNSGKLHLKSCEDYRLVKNLAEEFSVSPTAMIYRLVNLGLADK